MKMKTHAPPLRAVALAAALLGFAAPAAAVNVYVTYTGVVTSTTDTTSLFGGGNIQGLEYTARYVFDVAFTVPAGSSGNSPYFFQCNTCPNGGGFYNQIVGGANFGNASPALGAEFTLNGVTVPITGNFYGYILGQNAGGVSGFTQQVHNVYDSFVPSTGLYNYIQNDKGASVDGLPADIVLAAFSHEKKPGDASGGTFYWQDAFIQLNPLLLEISTTPPGVPLPAALPLFASGLGALGLAAWRRKRNSARKAA